MRNRTLVLGVVIMAIFGSPQRDARAKFESADLPTTVLHATTPTAARAAPSPGQAIPSLLGLCCGPNGASPTGGTTCPESPKPTLRPSGARMATPASPVGSANAVAGANPCLAQCARVARWLDLSIRFSGPWRPEEVAVVIDALDHYALALGEARFVGLIHTTLDAVAGAGVNTLTFVRGSGTARPPAGWAPSVGLIVVNSSLFDDAFLETHYHWRVIRRDASAWSPNVTIQQAIVGHEVGHVLVDGLEAERAAGYRWNEPLEELYAATLSTNLWPHPDQPVNESLATELALWAYGVSRPPSAQAFCRRAIAPSSHSAWASW